MGSKAERNNRNKKNEKKEKEKKMKIEPEKSAQDNNKSDNGRKIITDPRFSSIHFDPRFQKFPKHQSKVSIDNRFNRMFYDKNFASSSSRIDKRGKPKNKDSVNPLCHYYRIEEEELKKKEDDNKDEDDEEEGSEEEDEENENLEKLDSSSSSDSESNSELEDLSLEDLENDYSSTSDDEEDIVNQDEELIEPEENIPEIEQETRRLAVVNMDWRHVRAVDLYVTLSSFLPKNSAQILSVAVYPSEFGLKRMEEEEIKGPVGLFDSDQEKSDEDDDDKIDNEKLRAYEKSRLRYYFAVVECDSIATADHIYKNCDGMEFEQTSNKLDLRFIPDTMLFEHPPRDVATEAPTNYAGLYYQTRALQQSKLSLSWDEDEPRRAKFLQRNFDANQLDELEFKEFLASDEGESDDDENDGADKLEKYRALLQVEDDSDGDADDMDMEITFNTGLEDISKHMLEKKRDKESETVWEAYLRKRKEKKKARKNKSKDSSEDESSDTDLEVPEQPDDFFVEKPSVKNKKVGKSKRKEKQEEESDKDQEASRAELELLLADDLGDDHNLKGYNLKPRKSKGKKGKEVPAEDKLPAVDYDDPRFSALFTSPLFALDPTDAQYKRSAAYARQLARKQHKGVGEEITDKEQNPPRQTPLPSDDTVSKKTEQLQSDSMSSKKEDPDLPSMIRSMKRKAQQFKVTSNAKASRKGSPLQSNSLLQKKEKHDRSSRTKSSKKKARVSES